MNVRLVSWNFCMDNNLNFGSFDKLEVEDNMCTLYV